MTRINVGIPVECLSNEHLLAEHREIKRITDFFEKRLKINKFDDIPETFTLGNGHVKFFLDKGRFTLKRYLLLYNECVRRGFNVENYSKNWTVYKNKTIFCKDYIPSNIDKSLLIERISERLIQGKKTTYGYYEDKYLPDYFITLLNDII